MKRNRKRIPVTAAIASLLTFIGSPSFAEGTVAGVSSDPQTQSAPGNVNFENPCLFSQTLPLVIEENPNNNIFFLDNGAVLDECSNFDVTGQSSPNFLAYNDSASNLDGSVPALPAFYYFTNPIQSFQADVGVGFGRANTVVMYALDAGFNVIDSDTITTTSALQTMSVSGRNIQAVVIDGSDWLVVDNLLF